ncbi:L,D-transpeptidase family protein [Rufibacter radiotolerans]|uniref:L,D-transpeptidase family protein n=1 Tax=Rufibacter radiotolerans TaxID=1379910 RepID=UPI0009E1D615|nr:L,D-transpeptidase family protein [Rufibacter radiotolerans]
MKARNHRVESLGRRIPLLLAFFVLFLLSGFSLPVYAQATNFNPAVQAARLRLALQYYRGLVTNPQWKAFPDKSCLKAGEPDNCLPDLYINLKLTGDLPLTANPKDSVAFEKDLLQGVKKFQRRHGLEPDGIVGTQTLAALNISIPRRIQQMELNLRRWEADSAKTPQPLVLVNIPDYSLYVLQESGKVIWQTRVVVGQLGREFHTKPLESKISYFVLNPTWNVPKSIIWREIIPIMQTDPGYLARNNMTVYRLTRNSRIPVSPSSINWFTLNPSDETMQVIQKPGNDNALGRIKFLFDNPYHIYLHDTPVKSLFKHPARAYSHGCVRVQHPEVLAALLMRQNWKTPAPKPYPLLPLSRTEQNVFLPKPVAIKIAYYTCWVNDAGEIQFRTDIYGKDVTIEDAI